MSQVSSYYYVEELLKNHDEKLIKKELDTLPGVKSVSTNVMSHKVCVDYDNTGISASALMNKMFSLGYESVFLKSDK